MNKKWGRWVLDPEQLALHIQTYGDNRYLIPLAKCNSTAEVLDWIIQLRQKPWATGRDLCDLVDALDDLLNLEENYCGCGVDWTDGRVDYTLRILDRKFGRNDRNISSSGEEM